MDPGYAGRPATDPIVVQPRDEIARRGAVARSRQVNLAGRLIRTGGTAQAEHIARGTRRKMHDVQNLAEIGRHVQHESDVAGRRGNDASRIELRPRHLGW